MTRAKWCPHFRACTWHCESIGPTALGERRPVNSRATAKPNSSNRRSLTKEEDGRSPESVRLSVWDCGRGGIQRTWDRRCPVNSRAGSKPTRWPRGHLPNEQDGVIGLSVRLSVWLRNGFSSQGQAVATRLRGVVATRFRLDGVPWSKTFPTSCVVLRSDKD